MKINENNIQRSIKEVTINTPDSVTLALSILRLTSVEIPPSLLSLNRAHEQFPSQRTKEIAEKLLKLKIESLEDLTNLLFQKS